MQQVLHKVRDKYTYWLLLLCIPLEVLPFLCESDSMAGKILLIMKFVWLASLYLLHIDMIKSKYHLIFTILIVSMIVSSVINQSLGVFLLLMILFMSFILFPVIKVSEQQSKNLFLLSCVALFGLFVYSMYRPISAPAFFKYPAWCIDRYGPLNANTCGYLVLSAYFCLVSYLDLKEFQRIKKKYYLFIFISAIVILFAIYTTSRSTMLIIIAFLFLYLMNSMKLMKSYLYYVIIALEMLFCFVYYALSINNAALSNNENTIRIMGKAFFSGREKIWAEAIDGFFKNPIIGNGSDYLPELTGFSSAHNVLLGIMVIMGIIPTIGYIYFMFSPKYLFGIRGLFQNHYTVPQLCFIAGTISTVFECSYSDARLNFLFLLMLLFCDTQNKQSELKCEMN